MRLSLGYIVGQRPLTKVFHNTNIGRINDVYFAMLFKIDQKSLINFFLEDCEENSSFSTKIRISKAIFSKENEEFIWAFFHAVCSKYVEAQDKTKSMSIKR